ncbi:YjgP/YjgQ family permease [Bacteroides sp. 214]|uniref:LptF/LptG family permease n=1 Tax=Bacteroides sp. 214 TaxID=2302935 RepID=UPI0013D38243|nr:LptF/LptG family permease [Bacteroides sp. 214]NDW12184.1 YjgP/YjgQ family permease [Bacteroides sp. 214]
MPGIKKLDRFLLKSYLLTFAGTFLICLFIFMMQSLWKYVDELVGKGLEMNVLASFFYYSALTLVPAALPLAILLASLITFGNFGERYELLAMKAAGISLLKIMRPLIVLTMFLCCVSFYFQNVVGPYANVKLLTLLYSVKQKSPELEIPEGVFYDGIDQYSIYVKKKDRNTGILYDVMIYDFSEGSDKPHIIVADSGRLQMTADQQHLYLHLYSGESFQNIKAQQSSSSSVPYMRETFREKHTLIEFDSGFNMMDEGYATNQSIGKDMAMLSHSIDSMTTVTDSIGRKNFKDAKQGVFLYSPSLSKEDTLKMAEARLTSFNVDSLYASATLAQKQKTINSAVTRAESYKQDLEFKKYTINESDRNIRRHKTEWHRKLSISLSCLIFFFIGVPLGAIIRKGGLGMPVVISVLLFIFYYVIENMGYKMARDGKWIMFMGMWLSTAILAPLGAFLTYKSNNDSVVFNADIYTAWIKRVVGIRTVRHMTRKDVIIDDPDYNRLPSGLEKLTAACNQYLVTHRLTKAPNYFKLWMVEKEDKEIVDINNHLEELVDEMSNSKSTLILNSLNKYPIIPTAAHTKPFRIEWINMLTGLLVPVGLFFYFRMWVFRIRLKKDIEKVIKINGDIQTMITENKI